MGLGLSLFEITGVWNRLLLAMVVLVFLVDPLLSLVFFILVVSLVVLSRSRLESGVCTIESKRV